ncbi:MAG: Na+/H+ antiporter [Stenomitos rutilans HA7619-LM2]|jgi:CPA1 family monovalent cation:H+ antiporter|nr:Na+/H+ antiporter [Stenomitos rutilans HA7619-LM2]
MHEIEIVLGLLFAVTALAVIAEKIQIAYPILLVVGGLALGFVPGLPHVELKPDVIFLVFLPPLLTSAAWFTSWRDFRANLRPILLLAIGLVLVTTGAVAVAAHAVIAGMTWPVAFVLGAIVSPPDAVAAAAITERLSVPKRIVAILEGESLVNDATGLVAYRFAVAAVVAGSFSVWDAGLGFVLISVGGILVGLAAGWVTIWIHRQLDEPLVEVTGTLLMSYASYLVAEHLHVSGVLAAVAVGIYHRWHSSDAFTPTTRMQALAVWELFVFLLNGLVFILIGLQLPAILAAIAERSAITLAWYSLLISVVVIGIRILWVFPAAYLSRLFDRRLREREPSTPWQQVTLIGWTGMRGVVSLAAALALPLATNAGTPFPERDLVIFLTFCVILVTLVFQGLTLPLLIRWLKIADDGNTEREEMEARLKAAEAAMARLEELIAEDSALADAEMVQWLRRKYEERVRQYCDACLDMDTGNGEQLATLKVLQREAVVAERNVVVKLRNQGVINDEVLHRLEHELDLEAIRLKA